MLYCYQIVVFMKKKKNSSNVRKKINEISTTMKNYRKVLSCKSILQYKYLVTPNHLREGSWIYIYYIVKILNCINKNLNLCTFVCFSADINPVMHGVKMWPLNHLTADFRRWLWWMITIINTLMINNVLIMSIFWHFHNLISIQK